MNFLLKKIPSLLLFWFLLTSLGFSDPYKDLNIDFLLEEKKISNSTKKTKTNKKSKEKNFESIIKDFKK